MSFIKKLKFKMFSNWRENNTIIIPAIILKIFELTKKNCPRSVAAEPNAIKTKEKPKVKKIVLITIRFLFFSFEIL